MKTLTKKFRAIIHDGLPQDGWHEEQTGDTLLPDDALACEADTLDELRSALASAGFKVPDVPGEQTRQSRRFRTFPLRVRRLLSSAIHFLSR